jgi:hypothetical protein
VSAIRFDVIWMGSIISNISVESHRSCISC